MESLNGYLAPFGTSLQDKIKALYTERFLHYIRATSEGDKFFTLAKCAAEMTKSVLYVVDVVLDREGAVLECQCECAVGTGPDAHCKHVQCVLYGLVCFGQKQDIVTKETCTQQLQTFHHCKPFKGSPLKASQLRLRVTGRGREIRNLVDFYPRPPNLVRKEAYTSFFNNQCINYQATYGASSSGLSMPILQTIPPANIYAVAHDHDYLVGHPEDIFLDGMCIRTISQDQIQAIEESTRGQNENRKWSAESCKRLTSSNFGRICKCTEKTDKVALARSYLSRLQIDAASLRHGCKYEHVAVEKYEDLKSVTTSLCGTYVSHSMPYISCSPDRIVDANILLEVKCPYACRDKAISEKTVPYLKKVNGEFCLDQNHAYYYQVQGQMFCTNRNQCHFVVYTFVDMKVIVVNKDDVFIQAMLTKLTLFYNKYFRTVLLDKLYYKQTDKYVFE